MHRDDARSTTSASPTWSAPPSTAPPRNSRPRLPPAIPDGDDGDTAHQNRPLGPSAPSCGMDRSATGPCRLSQSLLNWAKTCSCGHMPAGPHMLVLLLRTLVAGIIACAGGAWTVAVLIFVLLRVRTPTRPGAARTAVRTWPPAQRSAITFYYLGWMLCAGFVLGAPANPAGIAARQCGPSVPGHVPCSGRRGGPGRSR